MKRKQGEKEAITILESVGIELDNNYFDDNSIPSMPDLCYPNGRKIEITHTKHNHNLITTVSKYDELLPGEENGGWIQRHLEMEIACGDALDRINSFDYEYDDTGKFTPKAQKQYKKDLKLLKEHIGYDPTKEKLYEQFSEFKCDRPILSFSIDNIIHEIVEDKGSKYPSGDVDLFLFATNEEFKVMKNLIFQREWNGVSNEFLSQISNSPFLTIYICAWDFERQEYNTQNPEMIRFDKIDNGLHWQWFNVIKD